MVATLCAKRHRERPDKGAECYTISVEKEEYGKRKRSRCAT